MTPPGIGHNNGPSMEPGQSWRKHVWTKAREELLPVLPIEVVRTRVRRAAELGLPYKTYASFRAQTGNDLIGFLFSSNALRMDRTGTPEPARGATLAGIRGAGRAAIVHLPIAPDAASQHPAIDRAHAAPRFAGSWSDLRDHMRGILLAEGGPADRYMLVGETDFERDWGEAVRIGGYLRGSDFFDPAP